MEAHIITRMENSEINLESKTFSEWKIIKSNILIAYFDAQLYFNKYFDYKENGTSKEEKYKRKFIMKTLLLYQYLRIKIKKRKSKQIEYTELLGLSEVLKNKQPIPSIDVMYECFEILEEILEDLGITKYEKEKPAPEDAYKDIEIGADS